MPSLSCVRGGRPSPHTTTGSTLKCSLISGYLSSNGRMRSCWHPVVLIRNPILFLLTSTWNSNVITLKKTAYNLKKTNVVFLSVVFLSSYLAGPWTRLLSQWIVPMNIFWPRDLDLWTWPRYPSTWHPYQNSSLYVCSFSLESETDTQTDRQTISKLLHSSRHRCGV